MTHETGLKAQIRADLTAAMKARDTAVTGTLRMVLAAITTAEVAGDTAKELTDDEIVAVLGKESKTTRAFRVLKKLAKTALGRDVRSVPVSTTTCASCPYRSTVTS